MVILASGDGSVANPLRSCGAWYERGKNPSAPCPGRSTATHRCPRRVSSVISPEQRCDEELVPCTNTRVGGRRSPVASFVVIEILLVGCGIGGGWSTARWAPHRPQG